MTRHRFSFVDFALSLPWAKPVLALIAWIKKLRAKPDPYAELNRRQRRALMFAKPGERRMRLERTFLRIAERKRKKGVRRGDHGAKTRRAYGLGYQQGHLDTIDEFRRRVVQRSAALEKQAA